MSIDISQEVVLFKQIRGCKRVARELSKLLSAIEEGGQRHQHKMAGCTKEGLQAVIRKVPPGNFKFRTSTHPMTAVDKRDDASESSTWGSRRLNFPRCVVWVRPSVSSMVSKATSTSQRRAIEKCEATTLHASGRLRRLAKELKAALDNNDPNSKVNSLKRGKSDDRERDISYPSMDFSSATTPP